MAADLTITVVTSRAMTRRFLREALARAATAQRRSGMGKREWCVAVFVRFVKDGGNLRTELWTRLCCSPSRYKNNRHFVGVLRPDATRSTA